MAIKGFGGPAGGRPVFVDRTIGYVIVGRADEPQIFVLARLGEETPNPAEGYGGWEVVDRPLRIGVSQWKGLAPYTMNLSMILDEFATSSSIQSDINKIESMARPDKHNEPPVVFVQGAGILHTDKDWVINSVEWGDTLINKHGHRTRQFVTLGLLQFIDIDLINISPVKKRNAAKKCHNKRVRTYRWKEHDHLNNVAKKLLGNIKCADAIKKANPKIRDWRRVPKDKVIKIP